jgi:glycolate oxidase FAD binding subunit
LFVAFPQTATEVSDFLKKLDQTRRPVVVTGGRVKPADTDLALSVAELNHIVDYPARDMTITVEAGVTLGELRTALASESQQLPIDCANDSVSLGGLVAGNLSGVRRYGYGTIRDYLIGVSAVDGQGREFKAGGRVVKNVAGYDLCKLLTGSYGTLAVITQMTFKLKPVPAAFGFVLASFETWGEVEHALTRLLQSAAVPIAVDVIAANDVDSTFGSGHGPLISSVMVDGPNDVVDWQLETLRRELTGCLPASISDLLSVDAVAWKGILDETTMRLSGPNSFSLACKPADIWRTAEALMAADCHLLVHAGTGVIRGRLTIEKSSNEQRLKLIELIHGMKIAARWQWTNQTAPPTLGGLTEAEWRLSQKVKACFDPDGCFPTFSWLPGDITKQA